MTAETFNKLLNLRIRAIRSSLETKAGEYATDDRLHNFKHAAKTFNTSPPEVCWSYMMKHLISIKDIAEGTKPATWEAVHEKIGDAINYLLLMEAILLESITDDYLAGKGE